MLKTLALITAIFLVVGCSGGEVSEDQPTPSTPTPVPTTMPSLPALPALTSTPDASSPPVSAPPSGTGGQTEEQGSDVSNIAYTFNLPNANGSDVSLQNFRGDKNVVIVFYRAFW